METHLDCVQLLLMLLQAVAGGLHERQERLLNSATTSASKAGRQVSHTCTQLTQLSLHLQQRNAVAALLASSS
jgi:hypothetical protein